MKLVGYLRVSTDKQVEKGMGLVVQEKAIRKWAKDNGHRLAKIYRDEGISGSNGINTRIGLHQALQAIQNGDAEGLVTYKLDRLARQLTIQEATLAQVWKYDGHVFTCDIGEIHPDDPDDPMRTAMRQMVGVFAELERGMIRARMRAGREAKKAQNNNTGYAYGRPGLGMMAKDRSLVPNPEEQATVKLIMDLHQEGESLRSIIKALEAAGHKPKTGTKWYPSSINSVIRRNTDTSK